MNRIALLLWVAGVVAPAALLTLGPQQAAAQGQTAAAPSAPSSLSAQERAAAAAVFRRDLQRLAEQEQANAAVAHTREKECLGRFFSAPCLEDLRQDMASKDQDIRLARAAANRGLRELEAIERFQRRAEGAGNAR